MTGPFVLMPQVAAQAASAIAPVPSSGAGESRSSLTERQDGPLRRTFEESPAQIRANVNRRKDAGEAERARFDDKPALSFPESNDELMDHVSRKADLAEEHEGRIGKNAAQESAAIGEA